MPCIHYNFSWIKNNRSETTNQLTSRIPISKQGAHMTNMPLSKLRHIWHMLKCLKGSIFVRRKVFDTSPMSKMNTEYIWQHKKYNFNTNQCNSAEKIKPTQNFCPLPGCYHPGNQSNRATDKKSTGKTLQWILSMVNCYRPW